VSVQRISHEVSPPEPKRRKAGELQKTPETEVQLDLDLRTSADLDAILIALFD